MLSKPLGIAALAVATVAAAGIGSYLALRPGATQAAPATTIAGGVTPGAPAAATPDTPATAPPASGTPAASGAGTPVAETEAVVTPPAPAAAPVEAPRSASASGTNGSRPSAASASSPRANRAEPRDVPASRPPAPAATSRPSTPPPATTTARNEPATPAGRPSGTVPAEPAPYRPAPDADAARRTTSPEAIEPARPAPPPEPPKPQFAEYVLDSGSVMGLQIESTVSTATARLEDRVDARITRDVRVGGEVAVPAGSRLRGEVTLVEEGGKFKERARLGVRFHTLVLADGSTVPLATETIYREGDAVGGKSAAKIGGAAVGGAILGAILGGGKGAAIGGAAGAGAGTAATMAGGRSQAILQAGSTVTVRLSQPATVRVEKED